MFKFNYLVWLAAMILAGCAAFISVFGLSQLFAGAGDAVLVMVSGLEFAKLVAAAALHRYWDKLSGLLKVYLTVGVIVLISITSIGIYGFLSNGYQKTANALNIEGGKIGALEAKVARFDAQIVNNQKTIDGKVKRAAILTNQRVKQESRMDSLLSKGYMSNANKVRSDIDNSNTEIQALNRDVDDIMGKNSVINDSIAVYQEKILLVRESSSVTSEVGPLKYLSDLTGVEMDKVVNVLIIIIMLVFDPMAVSLLITANSILAIESNGNIPAEPVTPVETPVTNVKRGRGTLRRNRKPKPQEVQAPEPKKRGIIPKGKIDDDSLDMVREYIGKNRGFSTEIPEPKAIEPPKPTVLGKLWTKK